MSFPVHAVCSNVSQLWHWHEEFEILLCMDGTVQFGFEEDYYTLSAGDLVLLPGRMLHCILCPKESCIFTMKYSHKLLRNSPAELSDFIDKDGLSIHWTMQDTTFLRDLILHMKHEFEKKEPGWRSYVSQNLYAMQAYAVRHLPRRDERRLHNTHRAGVRIREVLLYVGSQYKNESFSMLACAKHFNFNPNYFSTFFSKSTGISFHKYVQMLRLREFEHLLLSTDDSVTECAFQAGFSSIKTLNRQFRELWNLSPTQYRQQNR